MLKFWRISPLFVLVAISLTISVSPTQTALAAGGAGTTGSPYQISTCAELFEIDDSSAKLSAHYALTANIDCSATTESPMPASGSTYFSGSLNGAEFSITGLDITCSSGTRCALFSEVTGNVVIKNLTIVSPIVDSSAATNDMHTAVLIGRGTATANTVTISNVAITGGSVTGKGSVYPSDANEPYTGSLVGWVKMGAISNSQSSATVSGSNNVGGLAGYFGEEGGTCDAFGPNISGSSFSGSVSGLQGLGGITGSFSSGFGIDKCAISNSFNTGTVGSSSGCTFAGGIVGWLYEATVVSSYNSGQVGGSGCTDAGGVVGKTSGRASSEATKPSVVRTYSSGAVTGTGNIGGVVGVCNSGQVSQSYSSGLVTGTSSFAGGLIGNSYCSIQDSYSTGNVNGGGSKGGLVGQNGSSGSISRSYSTVSGRPLAHTSSGACSGNFWDISTGAVSSACASGKTSVAMKTQSTFADASWNFDSIWKIDPLLNGGYPLFRAAITDTVLPALTSGELKSNGTTLVLTFSEALRSTTAPANTFTVGASAATLIPTSTSISGSNITLTLPSLVASTATVTISYAAPAASPLISNSAVQDIAGNDAVSFSGQSITNNSADVTAPTVSWTEPASPTSSLTFSYTLTFSEAVSGIVASDFSSTGTATGCVFSPDAAVANPSVTVSVTCTGNGTFVAQLKAGMVSDAASNTGPASLVAATSVTVAADITSPTASWTEPTSPSSSRTLSYTLTFSEAVSGIVASDFSSTGTATGCVFTPGATTANLSVTVSVTCASDGTIVARLNAGSVVDAASNTGPSSNEAATSVTIASPVTPAPSSTTTTVASAVVTTTTSPTTTVAASGVTTTIAASTGTVSTPSGVATTTAPSVGQSQISTVTTLALNKNSSNTTAAPTVAGKGVENVLATTTSTMPVVTTTIVTKLSTIALPPTSVGSSNLLINGKVVEGVITREDNRLVITAGPLVVRIWAVAPDGGKLSLDSDGRLRVSAGDSVTVDASGFSFDTRVEVRLYSDPVLLGRTNVDGKGILSASYEIPEGIPSGNHNVVLIGERDGDPVTLALSVALGEESQGNGLTTLFIGVLLIASITALSIPAFLRRRKNEESGES